MGTEKRERKKAGHRARLDAERAAQTRLERRRRITIAAAVPLTILVIVGLVAVLSRGSGTATDSASSTTASSTPLTTAPVKSAAGKPCVSTIEVPPVNAPTVDVPVGPPPTTLQITDITTGTGPAVTAADKVTVNYIGVACSSGAIFDESYTRGEPVTFGLNEVIPGWTQGLQGMQVGGVRRLVIPPELGYGSSGQGARIAPDETLVFVVELKAISPA